MPLFVNSKLNIRECLSRIDYWTDYMRTGATADMDLAHGCLTLLHKLLAKELLEK